MGKIFALLLVCFSLVFYGVGEYLSKAWSLKPSWSIAIFATTMYALGAVMWLPALKEHGQLSALSAVWSCLSIIVCVVIGVWCFGETLSPRQVVGLALALIATLLTI